MINKPTRLKKTVKRKANKSWKDVDWSQVNLDQPLRKIAEQTGLSFSNVRNYKKRNFIKKPKPRICWDQVDLLRSTKEIAKEFGVLPQEVYQQRYRRGISVRAIQQASRSPHQTAAKPSWFGRILQKLQSIFL